MGLHVIGPDARQGGRRDFRYAEDYPAITLN